MLNKIKLFWNLFRQGSQLKDKAFWDKGFAYVVPALVSVFVGVLELARAYNINLALDPDTIYSICGAIYFAVCTIFAFVRSKHVGLPSGDSGEAQQAVPEPSATGSDQGQPIVPPSPVSGPSSRFDEDTLKRATEWVERQKVSYPGPLEGAG